MAELIYYATNDGKQVILEYPPGGSQQRVSDIFLTNPTAGEALFIELYPGNSPNPHQEEVLAGAERRPSTLPPGLMRQIRIDDTDPENITVSGFRFVAGERLLRPEGGYGG